MEWSTISEFVIPIACVILSACVGAILEYLVQRRVATSHFVRRYPWLGMALESLEAGILFWVTALGVHVAITTSSAPPAVLRLLDQTLAVLVVASITIVAARFVKSAVLRLSHGPGSQIASGTLFATVAQALVIVLGVLFTLSSLGIEITPLLTALGVGGLAVALALQPPLANLFSGIQLIASRQIRPGDYVALASGQAGYVEDINWRSISIREAGNNLVVVPNLVLAQEVFTNYRLPEPSVAAHVPLRVAYGSDLEYVERLAREAIGQLDRGMKEATASRDAVIHVVEFADTTVNLTVNFFVNGVTDHERARSEFLRQFYDLMKRDGIGSPIGNPVVPRERAITGKA